MLWFYALLSCWREKRAQRMLRTQTFSLNPTTWYCMLVVSWTSVPFQSPSLLLIVSRCQPTISQTFSVLFPWADGDLSLKVTSVCTQGKLIVFKLGLCRWSSGFYGRIIQIMQMTCVCNLHLLGCRIFPEWTRLWWGFLIASRPPPFNTSLKKRKKKKQQENARCKYTNK